MAEVDDLQAKVQQLDASVQANTAAAQDLIDAVSTRAQALQAEIDTLTADDAVENTKLVGLQEQVDGLNTSIEQTNAALQSATQPPATP